MGAKLRRAIAPIRDCLAPRHRPRIAASGFARRTIAVIPRREPGGLRFTCEEARTQEGGSFSGYQPRSFSVACQNPRTQESGDGTVTNGEPRGFCFPGENKRAQESRNVAKSCSKSRSFRFPGKNARAQESRGFTVGERQSDGIGLGRASRPKEGFTRTGCLTFSFAHSQPDLEDRVSI